ADFQRHPELLGEDCFAVTHAICPEQIVTEHIRKLIEFPEALQVLEFARGKVSLVAVRAVAGGPLVSQPLGELRAQLPDIDAKVVAIYREEQPVAVLPDTRIQPGDEVFVLSASARIRD